MSLSPHALALAEAAGHPLAAHARAVAELTSATARELGLEATTRQELEIAALLHDIGRLVLMEQIPDRPEGLTSGEIELVKAHSVHGEAILAGLGEHFANSARIVRSCQERWDGTGTPDGLTGEEIPIGSRIIFCCGAYEAMRSDHPYSAGASQPQAIAELWSRAGTQFDPKVVSALVRVESDARVSRAGEPALDGGASGRLVEPAAAAVDRRA